MNIIREESPPQEVVLKIELTPDDIEPFLARAYRRVVNRVRIPGFRPGKAPRAIVERFVGRGHLLHEALEFLIPESVAKAIQGEKLEAFAQPDVELLTLEPLSIKATVPLPPQVELSDYRSLRLGPEPVTVTEENVDQAIEHLRSESAPWEPVDRPVQFGDLITINVEGVVEGRPIANDKAVEYIPQKDNPFPFPGFSVHLEGLTRGQSKTFTLPVPDDFADTTVAGKESRYTVEVLEIKAKTLPALDDEFAKGVGEGFEGLDTLKTKVRENLTAEMERIAKQQLQDQALDKVIEGSHVELSPLIITREVDHLMEDRARAIQSRRMDMDTYLQSIGKSEEELRKGMEPLARERLVRSLVLRKLAEEEKVEVKPEEVNSEVARIVSRAGSAGNVMRRALSSDSAKATVESSILASKTLDRLADIVQGKGPVAVAEGASPTGNAETSQAQEGGTPLAK